MSRNKRPLQLETVVYNAVINDCNNVAKSRGEQLAHLVAKNVSKALLTKTQAKVYNAIGKTQSKYPDGVLTSQVAKSAKMPVATVSAILTYLHSRTKLLEFTYEGRTRLWTQK